MIVKILRSLFSKLGIDKAIFYTSIGRVIQALGGIITILFIAKYLTVEEQGFYYTFGSIVAIQIFFELGLNSIITQYVAHEASHLKWVDKFVLDGESKYLSRLSSILHFSAKWYLAFASALFFTLLIVGFVFFTKFGVGNEVLAWKMPWILLAFGTVMNLLLTPVLAFLEGLNKVRDVAQIRLCQYCISIFVVLFGLACGAKLYVLGFNSLFGAFVIIVILFCKFKHLLLRIWKIKIQEKVNYRDEIFPYQWKIALSWISGYFIFHLFNPVLFATEGAIVAGQMGMTLAALNGIQALSFSWMTTKIPLYSGLIAQKNYQQLDSVFNRTLKQSLFINGFALIVLLFMIYLMRHFTIEIGGLNFGNRFLDYTPMVLMMIPLFINQFVSSWAIYLRCHKQEPFLINSIVGGFACCLSTILLGKYFGVLGVTGGYCIIVACFMPWGYYIYKSKKREWHSLK